MAFGHGVAHRLRATRRRAVALRHGTARQLGAARRRAVILGHGAAHRWRVTRRRALSLGHGVGRRLRPDARDGLRPRRRPSASRYATARGGVRHGTATVPPDGAGRPRAALARSAPGARSRDGGRGTRRRAAFPPPPTTRAAFGQASPRLGPNEPRRDRRVAARWVTRRRAAALGGGTAHRLRTTRRHQGPGRPPSRTGLARAGIMALLVVTAVLALRQWPHLLLPAPPTPPPVTALQQRTPCPAAGIAEVRTTGGGTVHGARRTSGRAAAIAKRGPARTGRRIGPASPQNTVRIRHVGRLGSRAGAPEGCRGGGGGDGPAVARRRHVAEHPGSAGTDPVDGGDHPRGWSDDRAPALLGCERERPG